MWSGIAGSELQVGNDTRENELNDGHCDEEIIRLPDRKHRDYARHTTNEEIRELELGTPLFNYRHVVRRLSAE